MSQHIGRVPSRSSSFPTANHGGHGVGGGRMQRPSELPTGGPGQVAGGQRGHKPEQLGGGFDRVVSDGFDGGGRGRPAGLHAGAPSRKPEGVNGPPAGVAGGRGDGAMRPYGLPEGAPSEKPEGVNGPPAGIAGGRGDAATQSGGLPPWALMQESEELNAPSSEDGSITEPDPMLDIRQLFQTLRSQNVQG